MASQSASIGIWALKLISTVGVSPSSAYDLNGLICFLFKVNCWAIICVIGWGSNNYPFEMYSTDWALSYIGVSLKANNSLKAKYTSAPLLKQILSLKTGFLQLIQPGPSIRSIQFVTFSSLYQSST